MSRQMVFEDLLGAGMEQGSETLGQLPPEQRGRLVGLIAELMNRAAASVDPGPPTCGDAAATDPEGGPDNE